MGHRSFTLIELVVVIAVVLLLAGITLSVSVAVVEHAELRRTDTTMRLLDAAVREWELAADRKLSWRSALRGNGDARHRAHARSSRADLVADRDGGVARQLDQEAVDRAARDQPRDDLLPDVAALGLGDGRVEPRLEREVPRTHVHAVARASQLDAQDLGGCVASRRG